MNGKGDPTSIDLARIASAKRSLQNRPLKGHILFHGVPLEHFSSEELRKILEIAMCDGFRYFLADGWKKARER